MFKNAIFSKSDFDGKAKGGIYFRSFDLSKFLEGIEAKDEEVVGFKFEGNNVEILINSNPRIKL